MSPIFTLGCSELWDWCTANGYDCELDGELMQFTGLKDRNGKEIYESDIVDFAGLKPIEILWNDGGFVSDMFGSDPIKLTQEGMAVFAEVLGNIYENPELLTKA